MRVDVEDTGDERGGRGLPGRGRVFERGGHGRESFRGRIREEKGEKGGGREREAPVTASGRRERHLGYGAEGPSRGGTEKLTRREPDIRKTADGSA
ncbi:hypothetical protein GCM10010345_31720 [Streptomyces canarius]|uniref:Uncharacterized protein n=1 Tax=Streptomyces canarius TaxID=285453 RepID=A0ABQ3CQ45_9ACTN|nr:hypothetical protein GCM10010345_31720 [Streptomyces canarius]